MPVRVRLSRAKGWRMPPNTVKVDRSTRYGNPAVIGQVFEGDLIQDATHAATTFRDLVVNCVADLPFDVNELRGKNLACWCRLDQPCHADVLLELANAPIAKGDGETLHAGRSQ